jgi:hypothetical protein
MLENSAQFCTPVGLDLLSRVCYTRARYMKMLLNHLGFFAAFGLIVVGLACGWHRSSN